jgi:hypothetical protein
MPRIASAKLRRELLAASSVFNPFAKATFGGAIANSWVFS